MIEHISQLESHNEKEETKLSDELVDTDWIVIKKVLEEKIKKKSKLVRRVMCQEKESKTNLIPKQVKINMITISEVTDKGCSHYNSKASQC